MAVGLLLGVFNMRSMCLKQRKPVTRVLVLAMVMGAGFTPAVASVCEADAIEPATVEREFEQAKRSIGSSDNLDTARRILNAVRTNQDAGPADLAVWCDRAAELLRPYPQWSGLAVEAMRLRAHVDPVSELDSLNRAYAFAVSGRRRAKEGALRAAASLEIEVLLDLARASGREDMAEAADLCFASAIKLATAHRDDRIAEIQEERVALRIDLDLKEIGERLAKRRAKPGDAKDWARLQLLERGDPAAAARHVYKGADSDLQNIVKIAHTQAKLRSPAEHLRLGDWYVQQLQAVSASGRVSALDRAVRCYRSVLGSEGTEDAFRVRATHRLAMLGVAPARTEGGLHERPVAIDDGGPEPRPRETERSDRRWTHLLVGFDPPKDAVGMWSCGDGELRVTRRPDIPTPAQILLPCLKTRSYRCVVRVTYDDRRGQVGLMVPTSGGTVRVGFDAGGHVHAVGKSHAAATARPLPGRPNEIDLRILEEGDQLMIWVLLNGSGAFAWKGDARDMRVDGRYKLPDEAVMGVYASNTNAAFHDVRIRSLSESESDHVRVAIASAGSDEGSRTFFGISTAPSSRKGNR